jgi:ParB family chromosome partitioning protein
METTQNAQTQEVEVSRVYLPDCCREVSSQGQDKITRDIRDKGLIQEIVVAEMPDGRKELVAGQRRFKAVQTLGWKTVRARVLPLGISELDKELLRIAENEEREDVSPIDKALSYKRAIEAGHLEKQKFAEMRGMSNAAVSQYLALAELPEDQRLHFSQLKLELAHITEILRLPNPEDRLRLAEEASKESLTSKEVRSRVNKVLKPTKKGANEPAKEEKRFQFQRKENGIAIRAHFATDEDPHLFIAEFAAALGDFLVQPHSGASPNATQDAAPAGESNPSPEEVPNAA